MNVEVYSLLPVSVYYHKDRLPSLVNFSAQSHHNLEHSFKLASGGFIGIRYDASNVHVNDIEKNRKTQVMIKYLITKDNLY